MLGLQPFLFRSQVDCRDIAAYVVVFCDAFEDYVIYGRPISGVKRDGTRRMNFRIPVEGCPQVWHGIILLLGCFVFGRVELRLLFEAERSEHQHGRKRGDRLSQGLAAFHADQEQSGHSLQMIGL